MTAIDVTVDDTIYQAAPTIYFARNSTNLVDGSSVTAQMQQRVLASVQQQLATRNGARITIEGMTSRDEEARLARERVSWVLRSLNTDPNLTTVVTSVGDSVTHPELADEQRRVRILIDGEAQVLEVHGTSSVKRFTPIELTAVHSVTCEAGPCTESIEASANVRKLDPVSGRALPTFVLNEADMSGSPLRSVVRVDASLTDSLGQTARSSATKVVVALERVGVVKVVRAAHGGVAPMNELTLGFCDFDKATMSAIDRSVIERVREATARGARITIIPSTDGFGSSEYNDKLQRRRAAEAMDVLGVLPSQVDVELTPVPKAVATTPMERIEQRSVRVRITDVRP
ncbi:MAG: hypothetical protein EHM43_05550 [Ignavibacteriae bacterium]|nr:MAG: hypothetical protein EHM43_05550 [Ignavibacteriota bacterium]